MISGTQTRHCFTGSQHAGSHASGSQAAGSHALGAISRVSQWPEQTLTVLVYFTGLQTV